MKQIFLFFLLLLVISEAGFAQVEKHRWRKLPYDKDMLLWYDATQLDTTKFHKFGIWIIELHKPAISQDGVQGVILRTKTLYLVDKKLMKYGIKTVVYYDAANKEITRFNYNIDQADESFKYYLPVYSGSFMESVIQELSKIQNLKESEY